MTLYSLIKSTLTLFMFSVYCLTLSLASNLFLNVVYHLIFTDEHLCTASVPITAGLGFAYLLFRKDDEIGVELKLNCGFWQMTRLVP